MDDLISRDAAIEIASGYCHPANIAEELGRLPSADAVEVVRCRECKHRYIDGENVRYNVCDLNHNKVHGDDWYCADGERKDD